MRDKWLGNICPKIRKKVAKNADMANTCYVLPAGQGVFQVQDRGRQYIVKLNTKHCDCRRWDLTGIPCSHVISCLRHERIPQESMVAHCYSVEAFAKTYNYNIWPCNDMSTWIHVEGPKVLPPKYEKRIGRPPKSRRKAPHEVQGKNGPRFSKHGGRIRCSYCKDIGHNVATCEHKKAGRPPRQQPMEPMPHVTCIDIADGPTLTQETLLTNNSAS